MFCTGPDGQGVETTGVGFHDEPGADRSAVDRPAHAEDGVPDGGLDERDADEPGPQPREQIAQVLSDCHPQVAVQRLENQLHRISGARRRRGIGRDSREILDRERPADQTEKLHERRQLARVRGSVRELRLEARRRPGAARLYRVVLWLISVGIGLLATA